MDVVAVPEGALNATGRALDRDVVAPLLARIVELSRDRLKRRAMAARALAGAVAGLRPLVGAIALDLEAAATDADGLRRSVAIDFTDEGRLLRERLTGGTVLREEVIRHWHSYVGADQITRLFSTGVGKVRGTVLALVKGTPAAPVSVVQQGAADDVAALVVAHASEASRRAAAHWAADPKGADLVAADPGLWSAAPDLAARTRVAVDEWVRTIAADVAVTGADKKGVARAASLGVNAGAITIMLATFAHTGGITGAEVGIAAATAFLNQKLMNALFGEAAVQEMIDRARERLTTVLDALLAEEQARFDGPGARCDRAAHAGRGAPGGGRRCRGPRCPERCARGDGDMSGTLAEVSAGLAAAIEAAGTLGLDVAAARGVEATIEERGGYPGDLYVLALAGGTGVGKRAS